MSLYLISYFLALTYKICQLLPSTNIIYYVLALYVYVTYMLAFLILKTKPHYIVSAFHFTLGIMNVILPNLLPAYIHQEISSFLLSPPKQAIFKHKTAKKKPKSRKLKDSEIKL